MEFQLSYFKFWKIMSAKVENSAVATGLAKVSFYSNPKERQPQRMLKLLHSCTNFTHWYVRMLECSTFSKLSFTNMWTVNFQLFKLVLEKAEEPEIKLPTSAGSSKKKRVPEKHLFLLHWLCQSLWLFGSNKLWKILKEMGLLDHLTCLLRNVYAGQEVTEWDMEQQTGSN